MKKMKKVEFYKLSLGTRFKYKDTDVDYTWVKLSDDGTIAKWDDSQIDTNWVGQSICCFKDNDDFTEKVFIVG